MSKKVTEFVKGETYDFAFEVDEMEATLKKQTPQASSNE